MERRSMRLVSGGAYRKALFMQRMFRAVARLGLGGYSMSRQAGVRYIETRHGKVRVLEYGFEKAERLPLYIDLHGGGFILGQADMDEAMNLEFLKAGVKIISIDYPKAPQHPYPTALEAVHDVIAWYAEHASKCGIDVSRLGIGGHSAGGNLATATCLRNLKLKEFRFAYQVLDFPALDLATDPYRKPCPKGSLSPRQCRMFNACYLPGGRAEELDASPALSSPADLVGMPPAFLIACGRDSLHDEGCLYAKTMQKAGVPVEFKEYPDQPHGFTYYRSTPDSRDAVIRMRKFIAAWK